MASSEDNQCYSRDRKRSEEHTSELQSPCNLVCRLLLEKKKKKNIQICGANQHIVTRANEKTLLDTRVTGVITHYQPVMCVTALSEQLALLSCLIDDTHG